MKVKKGDLLLVTELPNNSTYAGDCSGEIVEVTSVEELGVHFKITHRYWGLNKEAPYMAHEDYVNVQNCKLLQLLHGVECGI